MLTITGPGLTGATGVDFGNVPGINFVLTGTGDQITVTVPAGTGTVPVTVVTPTGSIVAGNYSYTLTTTTYIAQNQFGNTGTPSTGELGAALGIATDSVGHLYVTDGPLSSRIVKFNSDGTYVNQFGHTQLSAITAGSSGTSSGPSGVAVDSAGNIYVADSNGRIIKFGADGTFGAQFGDSGTTATGHLNNPFGVAIDGIGNVYVADTGNGRVVKFTDSGAYVTQFGDTGTTATGLLDHSPGGGPFGIAIDSLGSVFVTDARNNRVVKFGTDGTYRAQFGDSGITATGLLSNPFGIAIDKANDVFVTDSGNGRVVEFTDSGAYVGQFGAAGSGGIRQLTYPYGIAAGANRAVYVVDSISRIVEFAPQTVTAPAGRPRVSRN